MTLHQLAASVLSSCLQFRWIRMLIDRWQHMSECLICCHVSKWNVNESVGQNVQKHTCTHARAHTHM